MRLYIFAVRDIATAQYGTPMFLIAEGQAVRSFSDEINRSAADNALYMHPDDYELFFLGAYDTETGKIDPLPDPKSIVAGKTVKVRN